MAGVGVLLEGGAPAVVAALEQAAALSMTLAAARAVRVLRMR